MVWDTEKCVLLQKEGMDSPFRHKLNGKEIKTVRTTTYVEMMVTCEGSMEDKNVDNINKAIIITQLIRASRIHKGGLDSATVLRLCEMMVRQKAVYGVHLTSATDQLLSKWDRLKKKMVKLLLGIYPPSRKIWLRNIARLETQARKQIVAPGRMGARLKSRADARRQDKRAQRDPRQLSMTQKVLQLELGWTTERIREHWRKQERRLKRRSTLVRGHSTISALQVKDQRERKVGQKGKRMRRKQ